MSDKLLSCRSTRRPLRSAYRVRISPYVRSASIRPKPTDYVLIHGVGNGERGVPRFVAAHDSRTSFRAMRACWAATVIAP